MDIVFHENFHQKLRKGIDALADAVKVTMGPKGRNVAMYQKASTPGAEYSDRAQKDAPVLITNDGVTIAQSIVLEDPVENMGAQILKEAAMKANTTAGDGTTTAIVLGQCVLHEAWRSVQAGVNPLAIRKGIQKAVEVVEFELLAQAMPIHTRREISWVAMASCHDKDLGELVGEALDKVGLEGIINVEDSQKMETTLEIQEGITFERGFTATFMATNIDSMAAELYDPYILFCDTKFENPQDILPALILAAEDERSILIISEGVTGEALSIIERNKTEGDMDIVCVVAPLYGDGRRWRMADMALQTGGIYITKDLCMDVRDITRDMFGTADKVTVTLNRTTIIGPHGDPVLVENRVKELRYYVSNTDYDFNAQRHKERLAAFVSGIATIHVGGRTETELRERKMRVKDAVHAATAAYEEGIVTGVGIALLNTVPALDALAQTMEDEQRIGVNAVIRAMEAPVRQIAENAGVDGSAVVAKLKVLRPGIGFDAVQERYVNMLEAGISDPVKVTRMALKSAMSVAASLLTAEAGVVEINVKEGT